MEDSYIAVPDVLDRHRGVISEKSMSFFGVRPELEPEVAQVFGGSRHG
jgi:hypothetical protein